MKMLFDRLIHNRFFAALCLTFVWFLVMSPILIFGMVNDTKEAKEIIPLIFIVVYLFALLKVHNVRN